MVIPAEQMPMAQKPVMMRGRLPSFSMVKHCRGRAETTGVRRELQTRMGAPSEPQIQMEVGRCSQWHLGVGGSLSSELQGWDQGMGRARTPGSQGECALGGSGVPQSPIRVQGWGWLGWPHGCIRTSTEWRCWVGVAVDGAGRVLTAEQMPVIL